MQENTEEKIEEKITKEGLYTGFKVLMSYLTQYKKTIVVLSIMGIFSAIGNGVIPYVIGRFFDAIITPSTGTFFGFVLPLYAVLISLWIIIQLITSILDWRINVTSEYISNIIWLEYLSRNHLRQLYQL